MRVVIQRVSMATVSIDKVEKSTMGSGLLILLGIESADDQSDIDWLTGKILRLRIFDDEQGVMNKSITDVNGEIMVVSQFTLHASTKKGNRPSYIKAAPPAMALKLYNDFVNTIERQQQKPVKTGEFGAMMDIELINSGPVTILIDTKNKE
ncbi:MAG: D-aminoacyl-tRNA deacylase [Bacteroidales bacterium]|nr:D-aminoacyl-tRNA deacylase [Bacteroidales bacterium]